MDRVYAFPKSARHFHCFTQDSSIKQHPAYQQGKAGDADSALQLINDLAFDFLLSLQGEFPPRLPLRCPFRAGGHRRQCLTPDVILNVCGDT
ncbi:hypothetical protein SAMN06264348_101164 [Oceanospirillum linum]|nr:hypothetical protein SAMN04489856_101163 [Oleiphilus messinensis]SMP01494.1 hypothetical protein SAMN06264348_101164 [Oceanospirillum linum]